MNWDKLTFEMVNNLSQLIQIQTVNPPGNEMEAVLAIKQILLGVEFPDQDIYVVESVPGRGNLVARLRGDGTNRP